MGAVNVLKNAGARDIYVGCTHGVLCGQPSADRRVAGRGCRDEHGAVAAGEATPESKTLSVAPLFAGNQAHAYRPIDRLALPLRS